MDRLDELAIFVAVVQQGSSAAAGAQTAAFGAGDHPGDRRAKQRFGTRLVERTTCGWRPPKRVCGCWSARNSCRIIRPVVQDTAEAAERLRALLSPVQFGRRYVAPVVMAFLDDYPQMQIEMVNDRNLDRLTKGWIPRCASVICRTLPRGAAAGAGQPVTVASPDYRRAVRAAIAGAAGGARHHRRHPAAVAA